jgi:hypothetical protein
MIPAADVRTAFPATFPQKTVDKVWISDVVYPLRLALQSAVEQIAYKINIKPLIKSVNYKFAACASATITNHDNISFPGIFVRPD